MPKVAIVGATAWGITLGILLARKGTEIRVWARTEKEAQELNHSKLTSPLLSEVTIPPGLSATSKIDEALADVKAVIMAVPSQTMRQNIKSIKDYLTRSIMIVSAAKGLEIGTNKRMSEVIAEEINPKHRTNICVLSGPNIAREILLDLPAASVIASENNEVSRAVQRLLVTPNLCLFTHHDVIGVELGGALKNVIALGAGMADGLQYGDNAKAAFITRGLTEMTALGVSMGAQAITFSGLAGLGDLITTCASPLSRNHFVGVELAKGRKLQEILDTMEGVAEGVGTTKVAWDLAQKRGLEMPITERTYKVLYEGLEPAKAAADLMGAQVYHELTGRKWRLFNFFRRRRKRG